ncbi:tricarboxylate transport protein [Pyricularia oryzae Y34]|uniref:Tricarboxylate transport protein n=1 Tax=Pyricularia oryzae (strain Y34) TaxID=1143189 RepID=A0AA97P6T6_PYRO3|nr:tricarboxylate transport protein [Pyricularia oryzae Y34]
MSSSSASPIASPPASASLSATLARPAVANSKTLQSEKKKISPVVSLKLRADESTQYPFEFAKTRAQLQPSGSRNPFAVLSQVARQDGFRSIYTGCSTLILGTTAKAGVRFLSFDSIKNVLKDEQGNLSPARGILAGMVAGAVESVVAVTPTERVKTALIDDAKSGKMQYKGGFHALTVMVRQQGISEVYRGLLSTTRGNGAVVKRHGCYLSNQSATSAVRMGSYNIIKEQIKKRDLPQNSAVTFGAGAIAGTITVYATQPFDTVKTRSQSARGAGTLEAFRSVISSSGVEGLWSGSTMRLGRLVLSGGIVFTVYEKVSGILTAGQ